MRPAAPPVGDRGSATAEFAVGLPALVLMTLVAVSAVSAVLTKMECVDAAREAARAAARGESGVQGGARVAPGGATVVVSVNGDLVSATVRAHVSPLSGRLPGFDVSATAVASVEPGEGTQLGGAR
jgi:hypothetical protein